MLTSLGITASMQEYVTSEHEVLPSRVKLKVRSVRAVTGCTNNIYFFDLIGEDPNNPMFRIVIKCYDNLEDGRMKTKREFEVMSFLAKRHFPVPCVYFYDINNRFLDRPFFMMEEIRGQLLYNHIKQQSNDQLKIIIKEFAFTLSLLHRIPFNDRLLETTLDKPLDMFEYAKKQAIQLKKEMGKKEDLIKVYNWIEQNALHCPCCRYSVIHGDMNLRNFILTDSQKIYFLDWEYPEIGDALKDAALTYYNIRQAFGLKEINRKGAWAAKYFLQQYKKMSGMEIDPFLLRFYLVLAGLKEALNLERKSHEILNPVRAAKVFGHSYFAISPLIAVHFRQRYEVLSCFLRELVK